MIKPHKFLNLNNCVISVSSYILKVLFENKIIRYDDLFNKVCNEKGENSKYNFIPAIDFLFLLGKIKYHEKSDTVELVE